ncbi:hypothetical protein HA402_007104 [Bradysia odoriphaga]|nr:hypothetical protein HA402_007104 [Bradysia odoriphaga]
MLQKGEVFYCFFDGNTNKYVTRLFKGEDACYVDSVRLCGSYKERSPKVACVTIRIPRNPTIGDKFASRAGQKGICSHKWPDIDLPFTESGLIPDIMFNPHGFPSRMTIAMMIEAMAGKSAAVHGHQYDATPFRFNEENTAIDYFGKLLVDGGYKYNGTERLYSGIDGREMRADIFFGIVHYQRLRHLVDDKYQVRRTGPDDRLTRQPVKGRKRGGGMRFGEMEQNALLAHGASFLLQDRLFHGSDKIQILICRKCESILGPVSGILKVNRENRAVQSKPICRMCKQDDDLSYIEIPYIFKYLITQLSSVNINVRLSTTSI